jgi:hypothetical protein
LQGLTGFQVCFMRSCSCKSDRGNALLNGVGRQCSSLTKAIIWPSGGVLYLSTIAAVRVNLAEANGSFAFFDDVLWTARFGYGKSRLLAFIIKSSGKSCRRRCSSRPASILVVLTTDLILADYFDEIFAQAPRRPWMHCCNYSVLFHIRIESMSKV